MEILKTATRRTRAGGRDDGGERTACVLNNIYIYSGSRSWDGRVGEMKGVDVGLSLREFSQQRANSARGGGGDANGKKLGPATETEKNLTG